MADINVYITPSSRKRRGFIFGDYNTAERGWTLTGWSFEEPELQENYVEVPGRADGPLDMSTSLTKGDPCYNSRTLTATFECSDGTRLSRDVLISEMTNALHGQRKDIIFPDDDTRYATGRMTVKQEYSDMAHCCVTVTAVCNPWRYNMLETRVELTLEDTTAELVLTNAGRRKLTPEVKITGEVTLVYGATTWNLGEGAYRLAGLKLATGNTSVTCSGDGTVAFTYREAIL